MRYFTKKEHTIAVDIQINDERLAFADWLEKITEKGYDEGSRDIETALSNILIKIKAKIKELRSNPLPKQSVDGKGSDGK